MYVHFRQNGDIVFKHIYQLLLVINNGIIILYIYVSGRFLFNPEIHVNVIKSTGGTL